MKFSIITSLSFGLLTTIQAGFIPSDDGKHHGSANDDGIIKFTDNFALGVKEFGYKGKGYSKKLLSLVYEEDDGQLYYGGKKDQIYYPFNDDNDDNDDHEDYQKHKHPKPYTVSYNDQNDEDGDDKWKARGYDNDEDSFPTSKYSKNYYYFTLKDSTIYDGVNAIGEIAANHQFQFDNPIQPDALFSNGYSIVSENNEYLLSLNGNTKFWNSAVDDNGVYKIYDSPITAKSEPIKLVILKVDHNKW